MRRHASVGIGSLSLISLSLASALSGCGDNKPAGAGMCTGSFVTPLDKASLTAANDKTMSCTDGFQTDVTVATQEPDGTSVDLLVGSTKVATAAVAGAMVTFKNVQLTQGSNILKAGVGTTCTVATATVMVDCMAPICMITSPVISATHPSLNGVPVAMGGDRVSSAGSPYQVAADVTTNVEDGQPVQLKITNSAASGVVTTVTGTALGGQAVFPGVTLIPDGTFTVEAICTNKAGAIGLSTNAMYPVDSTAPDLTVSSPMDGQFFGPADLTNGAFKVCAQTTSADAVNLPATLGAGALNLSVAVGTASPDPMMGSVAVTAVATDACVSVACPSTAPVNLTVTLHDGAGNATSKTISQISCATSVPGVQILSPPGDAAPFADPTKHLLAATSTNTLKDQDATKTGAQFTVVACSDRAGMATLKGGQMGGTFAVIAGPVATVPAVAADNCTGGNVATFTAATIPESALNADGSLLSATALEVDVTDTGSAVGKSPQVDLWVASTAPTVADSATTPICNTVIQSTTDVTQSVALAASTSAVTLTVTPASSPAATYMTPAFASGVATFGGVVLKRGLNALTAVASDKAGNTGTLAQPCTVTVGTPPVVTFTAPAAGKSLCASGSTATTCIADADATTPGWQGPLAVHVTVMGVPVTAGTVTFTASNTTAPLGTATIDASGNATLPTVTIVDGATVTLTATTSPIGTNGVGVATLVLNVNTGVLSAPTAFQVVVKDRRQTSFTLTWVAPSAGAGTTPVAAYDIRYSHAAITAANFAAATSVPFTGSPQPPGMAESLDVVNLYIENDYFFAIAAKDSVGNESTIVTALPSPQPTSCTVAPCPIRASFNQTIINGPQAVAANYAGFGYYLDGSGNFVGDANSDILAAEFQGFRAYIFAGSSTLASTTPAVTFQGANLFFGGSIANVGDVDGDGLEDIAISSFGESPPKIYIYKGRATWAPLLMDTDATYVITADVVFDANSFLGFPITKLGDIDNDGRGDFAVGGLGANAGAGAMMVVMGATPFGSGTLSSRIVAGRAAVLTNPTAAGGFGGSAIALGAVSGTLVVGATGAAAGAGELVPYKWVAGALVPSGTTYTGGANAQIGEFLGTAGGGSGVLSSNTSGSGSVFAFLGGTAADPLTGTPVTFIDSNAPLSFGVLAIGGGFSGSNLSLSFIGDSHPDIIMAASRENNMASHIFIVDGSTAASLTSPADVNLTAKVAVTLPVDWNQPTGYSSPIKDINGDTYPDIAIGETGDGSPFTATNAFQGRVLVLW